MPVNKVRRNGSYAPLSAHFYKDDAIAEAGEAAEVLYVRGLSFCADVLSDGFISDTQLTRFVGNGLRDIRKRADRLAASRTADGDPLWRRDDERGGFWVTAWLKWNRSREEIEGLAKKDADRKPKTPPPNPESERNPDGDDAVQEPDSERSPDGIQPESDPPPDGNPIGFQPRARTPRHDTTRNTKNDGLRPSRDAPDDKPPNAADAVAAWVEGMQVNGTEPTKTLRGQAARTAKELLDAGNDPERVIAAARQAGRKGYATIDRELAAMNGRRLAPVTSEPKHDPTTGRAVDW